MDLPSISPTPEKMWCWSGIYRVFQPKAAALNSLLCVHFLTIPGLYDKNELRKKGFYSSIIVKRSGHLQSWEKKHVNTTPDKTHFHMLLLLLSKRHLCKVLKESLNRLSVHSNTTLSLLFTYFNSDRSAAPTHFPLLVATVRQFQTPVE